VSRFDDAAKALGVDLDVRTYPSGTRTAADAAAAVGCELGAIVKSLVFVVDGVGPVLALTSGSNRVDTDELARHFSGAAGVAGGSSARQASADEARDATGYAIGGTPPFGHVTRLPTVFDPQLTTYDVVWAAAGTPDTCFPIAPAHLVELCAADVVDVTTR
jgi:prolyl-tRNA editing enzyme YbaK/EbsC (Cys-tRNA(Pro) deacylase)